MDLCLLPFYIYIVLVDRSSFNEPQGSADRWRSFFNSDISTNDFLIATWVIAIVAGAIHLICGCNSLYMACVFRKISHLPPDMNPLEDNLTSRRRSKHKHKTSELSLSNKHDSAISLPPNGRNSPVKQPEGSERPTSFMATRTTNSEQMYSPHNPVSANASRAHLPMLTRGMYSQPQSAQISRVDFAQASSPPKPKSGLSRMLSVAASSIYSRSSAGEPTPPLPRKSSKRDSSSFESSNNWYAIHEDDDEDRHTRAPSVSIIEEADDDYSHFPPERVNSHASSPSNTRYYAQKYWPVPQTSYHETPLDGDLGSMSPQHYADVPPPMAETQQPIRSPMTACGFDIHSQHMDPLRMNPPTPPPGSLNSNSRHGQTPNKQKPLHRKPTPHRPLALAETNGNASPSPRSNTEMTVKPSAPPPQRNTPSPTKSKYYGTLASAISGVRHSNSPSPSPTKSITKPLPPRKEPGYGIADWLAGAGTISSTAPDSSSISNTNKRQRPRDDESEKYNDKKRHERAVRLVNAYSTASVAEVNVEDAKGRVISRSGADLGDGVGGSQLGGGRGVSGIWEDVGLVGSGSDNLSRGFRRQKPGQGSGWDDGFLAGAQARDGARNVSGKVVEEGLGGGWGGGGGAGARRRVSGR